MHGEAVRMIAERGGLHCNGLQQAAASLRRRKVTTAALDRRLRQLDAANGVMRRITTASCKALLCETEDALQEWQTKLAGFCSAATAAKQRQQRELQRQS